MKILIALSTTLNYPLAAIKEWYGDCTFAADGGRMINMTPKDYIRRVKPLTLNEESRENIDLLKEHILNHKTLDPLIIYKDGKEDGRHRAYAALELGIKWVPVIVFDDTAGKTVSQNRYK